MKNEKYTSNLAAYIETVKRGNPSLYKLYTDLIDNYYLGFKESGVGERSLIFQENDLWKIEFYFDETYVEIGVFLWKNEGFKQISAKSSLNNDIFPESWRKFLLFNIDKV